jgi:tRNA nucleotidyltransferase (CCA-adding enzyme)
MKNALFLQKILASRGYRTLAAGGFVRDFLMKLPPKDIDLATESLPESTLQILNEYNIKTIATGLKHGTITAVLDNTNYEITTLRIDKNCKGREAEVEFIKSFEEDAKRRDLTINALFMDLETQEIMDYVGGLKDIENNILRFVGDPRKRIQEDYLRILRFYRFAARYGYTLDEDSIKACREYIPFLRYISYERIRDEILKLLTETYVLDIWECHKEIIFYVFPELIPTFKFEQNNKYQNYDVYLHTGLGISHLVSNKDPLLSLSFLLHDVAIPFSHNTDAGDIETSQEHTNLSARLAEEVGQRLKLSSSQIKEIKFIVQNQARLKQCTTQQSLRNLVKDCFSFGDENIIFKLYSHHLANLFATGKEFALDIELADIKLAMEYVSKLFKKDKISCIISGADILTRYGLKAGPRIGILKDKAIQAIVNGEIDNNANEIWNFLDKEIK